MKRVGKPLPTWVNTVIEEKNLPIFLTYKELAEISGVKEYKKNKALFEPTGFPTPRFHDKKIPHTTG